MVPPDSCFIDLSANGGATWERISGISDTNTQFTYVEYDISAYLQPLANQYKIRFNFISDESDSSAGIFFDNLTWRVNSTTDINSPPPIFPSEFTLSQNYPNPFNPQTTIAFNLPQPSEVRLDIYDIIGRKVASLINQNLEAGTYSLIWDGRDLSGSSVSSGIYFYRLISDFGVRQEKMTLLK